MWPRSSVGIFEDHLLLDLTYAEDSKADMDMNIVMLDNGKFIEVQGTAEGNAFSKTQMDKLLELAKKGIEDIVDCRKKLWGTWKSNMRELIVATRNKKKFEEIKDLLRASALK